MAMRIGFIGSGQMASALARGFVQAGIAAPGDVLASDVSPAARQSFSAATGCTAVESNAAVVQSCAVLILAVKPQVLPGVLDELRRVVTVEHLVISIAAGISLGVLEAALGRDRRLVRVMPNTGCLVGASASAFAIGGACTAADAEYVERLFRSVGVVFRLGEALLDAVTGLSGSGPAYVFQVIEALSDGGVRVGLPRTIATSLAAQTVLGAAKMVLETGRHPAELKDMVTSPGGTTIAGLAVLERTAVRGAFIDAVAAAADRARSLAS
jgi:pyrroline-5-carboxylate reductase